MIQIMIIRIFKPFNFYFLVLICTTLLFSLTDKNTFGQENIPNFALYDIQGNRHILYELLKDLPNDGIMVINFTSIFCPPCKKEIPQLISIVNSSKQKVRLIFIYNEDSKAINDDVIYFNIKDKAFTDVLGTIKAKLKVEKIPTTLILNKNGTIIGTYIGYSDNNIKAIKDMIVFVKQ